jgi:hypothetical protein
VKPSKLKVITPVWAQRIDVERHRNSVLVTGWGHITGAIDIDHVPVRERSRLDILQRLHQYALRNIGKTSDKSGVYQFADAGDDAKLIEFCREFGPVWGRVQSEAYDEKTGTWTVTVQQGMKELRAEQRRLLSAVMLLAELNGKRRADYYRLLERMAELGIDKKILSLVHLEIVTRHRKPNVDALLPMAHWVLCTVLNENLPKLTPLNGEVIELPEIRPEGIRNALYHQLRLDYKAQRTIGTCLHCGSHFAVFRRDTRGCDESCRRALRNNKFWSTHKIAINKQRRADRAKEK